MSKYLDGNGLSHLWDKIKLSFTNVQANWNESDPTSDAYIQNKPSIPSSSDYVPTTGGTFTGDVSVINSAGDTTVTIGDDGNVNKITFGGLTAGDSLSIRPTATFMPSAKTLYLPNANGTLALQSQIPTLPTITDVTSEALTVSDSTKATIGGLKLYAYGNIRILMGQITAVNLTTSQTTIATVATGHRPPTSVAVAYAWDSARYNTYVLVGSGGNIVMRSNTSYTSGNCRVNAVWIVE